VSHAGGRARLLVLLAALTLTYALGIALIPPHSRALHVWADSGWPIMHAWVAVECLISSSRGKQWFHRLAYLALAAENVASVVALLYWAHAELVLGVFSPFPTPADLAFIAYTPVYAFGIFLLTGGVCNRSLSLRQLGDVGISIATMLLVGMLIYYEPSVQSGLHTKTLAFALAYPVASLSSMVFGLLALLQEPAGGRRRVIAIQFSSLTMHATAYMFYGAAIMTRRYEVGHALDPIWFGGLCLTLWAAREDRWLPAQLAAPSRATSHGLLDAVLPAVACAVLALAIGEFGHELPRIPPQVLGLASVLLVGSLALRGVAVLRLERELTYQNAGLLDVERAARDAAQALANTSALLAESLDYHRVLGDVARLVVKSMPGWCVIDLVEGDHIRRAAAEHTDPEKRVLLEELRSRFPPSWTGFTGQAIRLESPITLAADNLETWCENGDHLGLLRALGADSGIAAPLVARGRTLGAMAVVSSHRFCEIERQFFVEVARRAAIAIDNAGLYRESQEALRLREEFIRLASHELNTPVTGLILNLERTTQRLRRGPLDADEMLKMATLSERQGRQVANVVGDLIEFTQLEHNSLRLQARPVELVGLIRNVVKRMKPILDRASCRLFLDLEPTTMEGSWDPLRIEQVMEKLLANAAKFGAGQPIEVKLEQIGNMARISITDCGIGIAPSDQERIFARFERGVSPDQYGGLGLGLYVCRRIVEAHGGSIHAESQPDSGARLIVELPVAIRTETARSGLDQDS
jgi:signal transduction histidine kinase